MIDIHSHVLPGFDDGAATREEALEMLRMAVASGTTDIVATSHANLQFRFDPGPALRAISELQAAAGEAPRIHYGCELHMTRENIEAARSSPAAYSIGQKGYLLVEFSDYLMPGASGEILRYLKTGGLRPIVAHPERNRLILSRLDLVADWVGRGCLMQITAQSLQGRFGLAARDASWNLLARGLVHVVASDAHDARHRPPVLNEAFADVAERYGNDTAERLFVENPGSIIAGTHVDPVAVPRRKRSWYSFLARS